MIPALLPKQLTTCPDFLNFSTCSLVKLVPSSTDPPELVIMLIKYRKYLFVSILTWEMLDLVKVYDQSIASTKTKYIKLNTKTQFFLNNIRLLYTLLFLVAPVKGLASQSV